MAEASIIGVSIDRGAHLVGVVDDNPATRYATARVVRAAGFRTVEAGTGMEALAIAAQGLSAIVLDVHLPDIGGFEVCRRLRGSPDTALLPVIHLSAAYVASEDRVAGLDAGADAYLVHPVEPPVLVATLQALIRARLAEVGLRQSELRFRTIYDHAPSAMALIDDDGRFVDVNPAMCALLGRSRDELLARPIADFAPAASRAEIAARMASSPQPHGPQQFEIEFLAASGAPIEVDWRISSHVEPALRIGMAVDISARLELERRRQELLEREQAARSAAERHSRTKDDFVAVLSHELRTPLNSIAGWVHVLTRHGDARPDLARKGLVAIERSVKAQTRIIADILDVSRISSGKLRLHREWLEPGPLVLASVEALRESIDARRLQVEIDDQGAAGLAWLDATRFQQIVWNLLTNAVKYSAEQGRIRIRLRREAGQLQLEVQDEGQGIAPEFLPHLFDRFAQSDAPGNRRHGGLGLGLSIARHLAELHGGSIAAHSDGPGRGTTMAVTLAVQPGGAAPEAREPTADEAFSLEGLDVLVVEDNLDAAEMLMVVLGDVSAAVRQAGDFEGALRQIDERWPDVMVCDIGLPGRDGYELIRQLRGREAAEARRPMFAVALTAFTRPEDEVRAIEAGFDAHLHKPLRPHALLTAIATRGGAVDGAPGP